MTLLDADLAAVIGVVSSVVSAGITYGTMKEKIFHLDEKLKEHSQEMANLVSYKHFEMIISPINVTLKEIERDIKKLIVVTAHNQAKNDE